MKPKRQTDKDILPESATTLSKVLIAASAGVITGDPMIGAGAATFLTETFFGIRGRLKLKRSENFIIQFSNYIKKIKPDFDIENTDSEDFGDFFEQVLIKVSQTNSKGKLEGFKKITAKQILKPISFNLIHRYLELVSNLNDNHVILLKHWYFDELRYKTLLREFDDERKRLKEDFDSGLNKINSSEIYSDYQTRLLDYDIIDKDGFRDSIKIKRQTLRDKFDTDEFDFWAHDLRKLGVLEHDTRSNSYRGGRAFEYLYFSPFGKKAAEYIFN